MALLTTHLGRVPKRETWRNEVEARLIHEPWGTLPQTGRTVCPCRNRYSYHWCFIFLGFGFGKSKFAPKYLLHQRGNSLFLMWDKSFATSKYTTFPSGVICSSTAVRSETFGRQKWQVTSVTSHDLTLYGKFSSRASRLITWGKSRLVNHILQFTYRIVFFFLLLGVKTQPPKSNMEPESWKRRFPFANHHFWGSMLNLEENPISSWNSQHSWLL